MEIETTSIWDRYSSEMYFFTLKRVKNKDLAKEILQNSFLKIHQNIGTLKDFSKVKAWTFQIVRNEIANYFNSKFIDSHSLPPQIPITSETNIDLCCFDRFINDLPKEYHEVIDLVYFRGKKQTEAALILNLSLANVKVRIRRAKIMLTEKFKACCKFELNGTGKLVGESKCTYCN